MCLNSATSILTTKKKLTSSKILLNKEKTHLKKDSLLGNVVFILCFINTYKKDEKNFF